MANTMTPMEGLQSVNEYLDTRHHIDKNVTSNINDFGRVVFQAGYDFSTREILCNLLAGRGLLLPNLQICLSINLKAILGVDKLQQQLRNALSKLDTAFDSFLQHTGINSILSRLNSALGEITQIANMINFCGKPLTPISIPNTLENAMQSFLGKGKSLIDKIGSIVPDEIGGCLAFDGKDFNLSLFGGGILGDLSANWERVSTGGLTQSELDLYESRINDVIIEVDTLITDENNTSSVVEYGGSDFNEGTDTPLNTNLGVVHNPESAGIQSNAAIASQLQSLYNRFAGYPVIDSNGTVHDNVFKLILDDKMIDLLRKKSNTAQPVITQEPIYNYCNEIVGYKTTSIQSVQETSNGISPATPISAPGFLANGLDTSNEAYVAANTVTGSATNTVVVDYATETAETTSLTPVEVVFATPLTIAANESIFYTITAVGRLKANGSTTIIKKIGVIYSFNGLITVSPDNITTQIYGDNTGINWDSYAQNDNSQIKIYVKGANSTDIIWKVKLEYEKV
jgi:hypothetical protein